MAACLLTAADSCMCRYTKMDSVKCHLTLTLYSRVLENDGDHTFLNHNHEHRLPGVWGPNFAFTYIRDTGVKSNADKARLKLSLTLDQPLVIPGGAGKEKKKRNETLRQTPSIILENPSNLSSPLSLATIWLDGNPPRKAVSYSKWQSAPRRTWAYSGTTNQKL